MRDPKDLRERARKMLAEAAKLEKKNRQDSLTRAGEVVEGYFKSNFAGFNLDTFKEEIKKIFSGEGEGEVRAEAKAEPKVEEKSEPLPQPETEKKRGWLR